MTASPWPAILDGFAASLDALEAALAAEDWDAVEAGDWTPPTPDAPLDAGLLPRAEALARRAADCERRVREALTVRAAELGAIPARRHAAIRYSAPEVGRSA